MYSKCAVLLFSSLLLLATPGPGIAQGGARSPVSTPVEAAPRVVGAAAISGTPPVIDGRLNEAVWREAQVAGGFTQRRPNAGAPATLPTEVRMLYTPDALYIGARLTDHPDSVAAQLARRDESRSYSDWLYVLLDSDDDNRSAFVLGVNPREVQRDYILYEDGMYDPTWDAVWETATSIDSGGWVVELRIPFSQLRFNPGQASWGINFHRVIARREEDVYWSPTPPNSPGFVSRFGSLTGLTGLAAPNRTELKPYAVSRLTRAPGDRSNPFYARNEPSASGGMDLRYSLTSSFTLTATMNPDFGQVEADPSEVNLTAFETRFSERRPFFVEDYELFNFHMGGSAGQLVYTRRIGARPSGSIPRDALFAEVPDATTILGAAKVSGRTDSGWSIGALSALTSREQAQFVAPGGEVRSMVVEPLTSFNAVRAVRDFKGGGSSIGGVLTLVKRQLDGLELDLLRSSALTGGIDGRHRFGGSNYEVNGYMAGSWVQGSERAIRAVQLNSAHYFQRPGAPHLGVDSTATSLSGVVANLEVQKIGGGNWTGELGTRMRSPGVEVNDFGFQQQTDRVEEYSNVTYQQFRRGKWFRNWSIGTSQRSMWTFGGERVQTFGNVSGAFQLHNFWTGSMQVERNLSALSTFELRGGPALVVPGYNAVSVALSGDRRKKVTWGISMSGTLQDETDGHSLAFFPSLQVRPSPRADVSLQPMVSWNVVPAQYVGQAAQKDGSRLYHFAALDQTTMSLTTRLSYTFTPRFSLQYYAQPFISAGRYSGRKVVADPTARRFQDRFRPLTTGTLPDFNVKQFRSNTVLRWEYQPGSTLFVVWNAAIQDRASHGSFDLFRDTRELLGTDGTNTLLVKLSYWLNF